VESKSKHKADHVFLVIGRDLSKDAKDIETWGHAAVICDPWSNKYYAATMDGIQNNLEYISEKLDFSYRPVSNLQKFEPQVTYLKPILSREMLQEYVDLHKERYAAQIEQFKIKWNQQQEQILSAFQEISEKKNSRKK
jgi:hypothetical protein